MVSILAFASNSSTDSCCTTSSRLSCFPPLLKPNPIKFLKQKPRKCHSFNKILATAAASSSSSARQQIEDGSAEQFLENNSIADFMRFKRGSNGGGSGQLQTAVVTYRKKFPWSLLPPFLQVFLFFFIFYFFFCFSASPVFLFIPNSTIFIFFKK